MYFLTISKLFIKKNIEYQINKLKNKFKNNLEIYLIEDYTIKKKVNNIKFIYMFLFVLYNIPIIINIISNEFKNKIFDKKNYYCIFNNKYGVCKTILKNSNIYDIIKESSNINIQNKIDMIYPDNIIQEIKLIKDDKSEICLTNLMMNIDKNLNLSLDNFLKLNNIKYNFNDKIDIKYMSFSNSEEKHINDYLIDYTHYKINNIL